MFYHIIVKIYHHFNRTWSLSDSCLMTQTIISHDPYSDAVISNEVPVVDIEVKHAKLLVLDLDETLVHSGFSKPDNYDHEVIIKHKNTEYIIYVQKNMNLAT